MLPQCLKTPEPVCLHCAFFVRSLLPNAIICGCLVFLHWITSFPIENQDRTTLVKRTTGIDITTTRDITERGIGNGLGEDGRRQINPVAGKQLFFIV